MLLRYSGLESRVSAAPGHAHTLPTADIDQFASMPASFPQTRHAYAMPRLHKQNMLVHSGNAPRGQTLPSAPEKPAIDKVARPKLKYVAPDSLVLTLKLQRFNVSLNNPDFRSVVKKSFST
jgi:hypothetical protein